ncbi:S-layer homology domain-containing protein [Paenibacillus sp. GXUN7292]|uniref:S-layer homology domain-containing protein n=1 Tax=Paenibacillus sp. GXUN7292 TaxID=3422499 RepID=UPI003D7E4855
MMKMRTLAAMLCVWSLLAAAIVPIPNVRMAAAAAVEGMTDYLDNFSLVFDRKNARIETADAHYFGGDTARMTRNTIDPGYLVYHTPYELKSFAVSSFFLTSLSMEQHGFLVSADGISYTELTPNVSAVGQPVSNWQQFLYESFELPAGTHYLKIEVKGTEKAWTPQISKVMLNTNTASVTADPPDGIIGSTPLTVTLTSATEGAQIYYKTAADSEYLLYSGPLSLTEQTVLEAYAQKEGMEPSAVKSYTYYAQGNLAVDRFGQVITSDFPEKITNEQQLLDDVAADAAYYGSLTAPDWDPYGGLKNSKEQYGLDATGFYSIQQSGSRTIMATPEGNAFFSMAVNGLQPNDSYTLVTGREEVFEWLPSYNSEYKSAFLNAKDYFSYYLANRIKKYGEPHTSRKFFEDSWSRLGKWGFNSVGGWSQTTSANEFSAPYVAFLPLSSMEWAKIPGLKIFDIFAEGAEDKLDEAFGALLPQNKDNKLIIGYFLGNEYHYHEFIAKVPKLKASEAAVKGHFVEKLEEQYSAIEALNEAWNADFASFEEMKEAPLFIDTLQAQTDIEAFFKYYLDSFYGTVARIFHKYDSNHLLIGDRWLTTPSNNPKLRGWLAEASGRYMDVISINHYSKNLDKTMLRHVHEASGGKPIMLTEWGFGTTEQGLTSPILVADQQERGLRYRNYVEGAASLGFVVGSQWFSYLDQAATGRWNEGFNGEKYNFGLVNVADRPYKIFLEEVMKTNYQIYDVMLGLKEPYYYDFGDTPREPSAYTMDIPYTDTPIPINGDASSFLSSAQKTTLTAANIVSGSGGEAITADFYFAWDETNLYMLAEVDDPTPMKNNYRDANIWKGDGVELFFGPNDMTTHGPLLFYDSQIIFSAALENAEPYWRWFNSSRQKPLQMEVTPKQDEPGYMLEAAIPWEALQIEPEEGISFRFDFGFDDSEDGVNRKRQYIWNGTSSNATNRGLWGKAALVRETDSEEPGGGGNPPGSGSEGTGVIGGSNGASEKEPVVIKLEHAKALQLLAGGMTRAGKLAFGGEMYEVKAPAGDDPGQLSNEVRLAFSYSTDHIDEQLLGIYYWDDQSRKWLYVGGKLDKEKRKMVYEAKQTGIYAVLELDRSFADVAPGHWAGRAIQVLAAKHIIDGVDEQRFKPDTLTTRAEFAALLTRAFGLKAAGAARFEDVPSGAWYAEAVAAAAEAGIIKGVTPERFMPSAPISREQMAIMIVRAYAAMTGQAASERDFDLLEDFKDSNEVSDWAREGVAEAISLGIMQGKGSGQFAPKSSAKRSETAMVLWKLLQIKES